MEPPLLFCLFPLLMPVISHCLHRHPAAPSLYQRTERGQPEASSDISQDVPFLPSQEEERRQSDHGNARGIEDRGAGTAGGGQPRAGVVANIICDDCQIICLVMIIGNAALTII